jgi:hypothetical protein
MDMVEHNKPCKLTSHESELYPLSPTQAPLLKKSQTLVLVYVTIPAMSRLDPKVLETPACLAYYSVREVIVRRFIPARMRD